MDIILIILCLIGLVILYFIFGILLKFFLAWLPIIIISPIIIILGFKGGIINAFIAIILFVISIELNNCWQGSEFYLNLENKIDKLFYFKD
jgi:uncharacterized membrane protein (DUF485 family)